MIPGFSDTGPSSPLKKPDFHITVYAAQFKSVWRRLEWNSERPESLSNFQ